MLLAGSILCSARRQPEGNRNSSATPKIDSRQTMEEVGQVLNDLQVGGTTASDSNVRLRTSNSSVSSSSIMTTKGWTHKKNGRHITNIRSINVVNNFGMDRDKRTMEHMGWLILRVVLIILLLIWLGALFSVTKGNILPVLSNGVPSKDEFLDSSIVAPKFSRMRDLDEQSITKLKALHIKDHLPLPPNIFELSLFGNKFPSDFQLYTPHAPSCSNPLTAEDVSFTLVSQLSGDRLWMVPYHCERWGATNPMSIVVFTDRPADEVKMALVLKGCSNDHLTVQTVSMSKYDPSGTEYPVNLMRNLALSAVKTSHIVYADVDFWPSSDLYPVISNHTIKVRLASDSKLAAVIPVFQMNRMCRQYRDCQEVNIPKMPKHKKGLMWLIGRRGASAFDPTNLGGHGSTKYQTWRTQEDATFIDLPCIKSNRYEPYLTVRYCSELPPFQEGFTGYGKNKMTWAMQLRRVGYKFTQIGGAFLVHYPHLDSTSRLEWNKKPELLSDTDKAAREVLEENVDEVDLGKFKRARVDALFLDFKEWLNDNVQDEARTPKCVDALNDDYSLWVHRPGNKDINGNGQDNEEESEYDEENVDENEESYNDAGEGDGSAGSDIGEKEVDAEENFKKEEGQSIE